MRLNRDPTPGEKLPILLSGQAGKVTSELKFEVPKVKVSLAQRRRLRRVLLYLFL